jgi:ribonuclease HI
MSDFLKVYVDGSVRDGNPGIGGIGYVVMLNSQELVAGSQLVAGEKTNNEVEYIALIECLKVLRNFNIAKRSCIIWMDSALVYNQVMGNWKINYNHLRKLRQEVMEQLGKCPFTVEFKWTNRLGNTKANDLAQAETLKEKERKHGI